MRGQVFRALSIISPNLLRPIPDDRCVAGRLATSFP